MNPQPITVELNADGTITVSGMGRPDVAEWMRQHGRFYVWIDRPRTVPARPEADTPVVVEDKPT